MSEHLPVRRTPSELAADTSVLGEYLRSFSLPDDNIIATSLERTNVQNNLPILLESLSVEQKKDARYLSKFVAASIIGLFDAALNYVWNEVVLHLREKAKVYGLDLFYDAAVGGVNRKDYKNEEDLSGIKDSVMLDTCLKLEIISSTIYKKLDYILTMRNDVAASHPNVESIGGFELLGWLQTCVKDVLADSPSASAIRIKLFRDNLRSQAAVIDDNTSERLTEELKHMSPPHVHNLLITMFGMYVAPDSSNVLRSNIAKVAPTVWSLSNSLFKQKIGSMLDGYRNNLETTKHQLGESFLSVVDGKNYETISSKTVALDRLSDQLSEAHSGFNNYYTEPPIMREILSYVKSSNDIPDSVADELISSVLKARLGRGLSYQDGVSPSAAPLYDSFLSFLDDNLIAKAISLLFSTEINSKLSNAIRQKHLESILKILRISVISERLKEIIDYLLQDIPHAHAANKRPDFRELCKPILELK